MNLLLKMSLFLFFLLIKMFNSCSNIGKQQSLQCHPFTYHNKLEETQLIQIVQHFVRLKNKSFYFKSVKNSNFLFCFIFLPGLSYLKWHDRPFPLRTVKGYPQESHALQRLPTFHLLCILHFRRMNHEEWYKYLLLVSRRSCVFTFCNQRMKRHSFENYSSWFVRAMTLIFDEICFKVC